MLRSLFSCLFILCYFKSARRRSNFMVLDVSNNSLKVPLQDTIGHRFLYGYCSLVHLNKDLMFMGERVLVWQSSYCIYMLWVCFCFMELCHGVCRN